MTDRISKEVKWDVTERQADLIKSRHMDSCAGKCLLAAWFRSKMMEKEDKLEQQRHQVCTEGYEE